jgi:hypothetical protein
MRTTGKEKRGNAGGRQCVPLPPKSQLPTRPINQSTHPLLLPTYRSHAKRYEQEMIFPAALIEVVNEIAEVWHSGKQITSQR